MTEQQFGADSTADQVIAGIDLTGRRAVVTGGSSGLGAETARVLASAGAQVTLAVRNVDAGRKVAAGIRAAHVLPLDLDDRASIDAFVEAWDGPLDLLINNAGVMALPDRRLSPDGWEQHFATNHLGHFALTAGLHDALAAAPGARVVNLSSDNHRSPVVFDDINFADRPYDPWSAYAQSKTANILMAVEAARRWAGHDITVNAVAPGAIFETGLLRHVEVTPEFQQIIDATPWKTVEQGAATTVFVATSKEVEGVTGRYFKDCQEAVEVAAHAVDPDAARRLWDLSEEWLRR